MTFKIIIYLIFILFIYRMISRFFLISNTECNKKKNNSRKEIDYKDADFEERPGSQSRRPPRTKTRSPAEIPDHCPGCQFPNNTPPLVFSKNGGANLASRMKTYGFCRNVGDGLIRFWGVAGARLPGFHENV